MPKIVKFIDMRVPKTFRIDPKTLTIINQLADKTGSSQGKLIDVAIRLLAEKEVPHERFSSIT